MDVCHITCREPIDRVKRAITLLPQLSPSDVLSCLTDLLCDLVALETNLAHCARHGAKGDRPGHGVDETGDGLSVSVDVADAVRILRSKVLVEMRLRGFSSMLHRGATERPHDQCATGLAVAVAVSRLRHAARKRHRLDDASETFADALRLMRTEVLVEMRLRGFRPRLRSTESAPLPSTECPVSSAIGRFRHAAKRCMSDISDCIEDVMHAWDDHGC